MNNALTSPLCSDFPWLYPKSCSCSEQTFWMVLWLECVSVFNMSYLTLPFTEPPSPRQSISLSLTGHVALGCCALPQIKMFCNCEYSAQECVATCSEKSLTKCSPGGKHRFRVEPAARAAALPVSCHQSPFYTAKLNQPSMIMGFGDLGSCSTLLFCVLLQVTYQSSWHVICLESWRNPPNV